MLATPPPVTGPRPGARVRPLPLAIGTLAAATALIHLWLGATTTVMLATQPELVASLGGAPGLTVMAALFYANFAGYVALAVALYHPALRRFRRVTRWVLIGFTAITIVAYFVLAQGHIDAIGVADKLIEGLLIALLLVEDRRAR
jgi:ABC-type transport system involved in cytochrome c biogenesis permease subunit